MIDATAYPLCWPDGWPRTSDSVRKHDGTFSRPRRDGTYGRIAITFDRARRQLVDQLNLLHARNLVISTNARVRVDGGVYADEAERRHKDPGIAIYFTLKGKQMVMAQDAYISLAGNLRSLAMAVEAMRALERHGGGTMMERAFTGFSALPPPEGHKPKRPWHEVLRYSADPADRELLSAAEVNARFATLAKKFHPDIAGGSHELMTELNQARDDALAELEGN